MMPSIFGYTLNFVGNLFEVNRIPSWEGIC